MILPLNDIVILELIKDIKLESGIIVPDKSERINKAKVIACGPGRWVNGNRQPLMIDVGDEVVIAPYGPIEIKIDGKEYLFAKEQDIVAITKKYNMD